MLSVIVCITLIIAYFVVMSISRYEEPSSKTTKLTKGINKLLLFVPLIVTLIFTILFLTVLKGRLVERTSHALIVLNFWLYGTSFYVNVLKYFKNKKILFISIILTLVSVAFAIYLTPLDRYCVTMFSLTNAWAYLIGGVMLINWYYRILQKEVDEFNRNHKNYVLNKCNFLTERGYEFKYSNINWEEAFIFTKKDISIIFYYEWGDIINAGYEVQNSGQDYIYEDKQSFSVSSLVNDFNPNFNNLRSKDKMDYLISIVNDNLEEIEKLSKTNI